MKLCLLIFICLFFVSCAPVYPPSYGNVTYQKPIRTSETAYFYPDESCIESEYDSRDLTWRIANVANSYDRASYISTGLGLIGYMMDYANPRNHRGCR